MRRPKTISGVHISDAIHSGAMDDWLLQLGAAIAARKQIVYGTHKGNPYAESVQTERTAA